MINSELVDLLLEMAHAIDFLDDNPFRAKAYEKAARSISEIQEPIEELIDRGEISRIKGIGGTIASNLRAFVKDHDFSALEDLRSRLPSGYDELIKVPGLGMKRLKVLCRELGISTLDELLQAIGKGRLASVKGFSEKGIARLLQSVNAILSYRGWFLLDAAWDFADQMVSLLSECEVRAHLSGSSRRSMEVLSAIDILLEEDMGIHDAVRRCLSAVPDMELMEEGPVLTAACPGKPQVRIHMAPRGLLVPALFVTTGSDAHLEMLNRLRSDIRIGPEGVFAGGKMVGVRDEREIYELFGMQLLPPEAREGRVMEIDLASSGRVDELVAPHDLKGLLHVHSTFSDGRATIRDMVQRAHDLGYAWIGISDHSRSAYYAGGLSIKDLKRQFDEIDELNRAFPEMTVFKGIESDILPDGSLDYPDDILRQFDFVIASIHSHMGMDRKSMTERIGRAMSNPFTTMIGHPTGRVLLSRRPYEVDMDAILDQAASLGVIMELNANPMRLDLDWRLMPEFTSRGGRVAITPDAHSLEGLEDMRYGLALARKGLLLKESCINVLSAHEAKAALRSRWS